MSLYLTPEQKETGKENAARAADGLTRRGFMQSLAVGGAAVAIPVAAAKYFDYRPPQGNPVKAALIGAGDEGGVLVGEHPPDYLQFIAVADIRPYNQKRIIEGDPKVPLRKGFKKVYGETAAKSIKIYDDYMRMLEEHKGELEAVVIALPLHMHARAAIDVMRFGAQRGKPIHVLSEKLMAWNISQCKKMIEVAKETGSILSIGHQRHYSMLYAHASEMMQSGILGDVKHIRALWHRNFSWPFSAENLGYVMDMDPSIVQPFYRDGWFNAIPKEDYDALAKRIATIKAGDSQQYDSIEQLVRWRLYDETGGGLMAELGSHQLDACSIFLGKVHPLAVTGVGVKSFFRPGHNDRNSNDHVFVTYEFPGPNHPKGPKKGTDKEDVVVVTYSSINTNGFEPYGECVVGTRGTMLVETEQTLMLFPENEPGKKAAPSKEMKVTVSDTGKGKPALEAASTWGGPPPAAAGGAPAPGPAGTTGGMISRGYNEEMSDFAFCIRQWDPKIGYEKDSNGKYKQRLPRCHGEVAMADAIIALTANKSMRDRQRIEFDEAWFSAAKEDMDKVPDDPAKPPKVPV